jgi:hypothetical protein
MASENDLERLANEQPEEADFEDVEDSDTYSAISRARDRLRHNIQLFEFLANPELVKNLTKRERDIMIKQAEASDKLVDELDAALDDMMEE